MSRKPGKEQLGVWLSLEERQQLNETLKKTGFRTFADWVRAHISDSPRKPVSGGMENSTLLVNRILEAILFGKCTEPMHELLHNYSEAIKAARLHHELLKDLESPNLSGAQFQYRLGGGSKWVDALPSETIADLLSTGEEVRLKSKK